MFERSRDQSGRGERSGRPKAPRRALRPRLEGLEGRALLATLAPIANVSSPAGLGYQVPLDGGATGSQTFTATSSNPDVKVTPAQGKFWTVTVQHDSSGAGDPAFTGSMTFQLFGDLTPNTVSKIEQLITSGFYTSPTQPTSGTPLPHKNFHRIVPGFVAQAGSQTGNGTGSLNAPGFPFPDEFKQQLVFDGTGQLAMANAGDDTNDSQFFITYGPTRNLDYNHTIFGQLVAGQDTFNELAKVKLQASPGGETSSPVSPVLITGSTLSDTSPDGVLHIDTTGATAGETSNVTVTATGADGTTTTQTFQVNVTANVDSNGNAITQPAFLNPVSNLVVGTTRTSTGTIQGQTAVFQISATNPGGTANLPYVVNGGTSGTSFLPVQNAKATVDNNGVVTVTPNPGFTGVINLQVGVGRTAAATAPGDYDTQKITLTVQDGQLVNLQPIAVPGSTTVTTNQSSTVQLTGLTANPDSTQTLTYTIATGPQHGTLTNFDPTTGTFTYKPNADYIGTDTVNFSVTDNGAPTPSLTSPISTFTINVSGADTGAVRLLNGVLIVTPPPTQDLSPNTIGVSVVDGKYEIRVNGQVDAQQPAVASVTRLVVYGTKANDTVNVGPEVTVPQLISGGIGGKNVLQAGGGGADLKGWYGLNRATGGAGNDFLVGRVGHLRPLPSAGSDLVFLGQGNPGRRGSSIVLPGGGAFTRMKPPTGTFYRFIGKHLVPVKTPSTAVRLTNVPYIAAGHEPVPVVSGAAAAAARQAHAQKLAAYRQAHAAHPTGQLASTASHRIQQQSSSRPKA